MRSIGICQIRSLIISFVLVTTLCTAIVAAPIKLKVLTTIPAIKTVFSSLQPKLPNIEIDVVVKDPLMGGLIHYVNEFNTKTYDLVVGHVLPEWLTSSVLTPLDTYIQRSKLTLPPLVQQMRYSGQLYDLPITVNPYVIAYNIGLFDKHNLSYPSKSEWTWNDFRTMASTLTERSEDGVSVYGAILNASDWPVAAFQNGYNQFMQSDADISGILGTFTSMVTQDQTAYYPRKGMTPAGSYALGLGNVAMQIFPLDTILSIVRLAKKQVRSLGIVPLPMPPSGGNGTYTTFSSAAITASSKYAAQSWQAISLLFSDEGQKLLAANAVTPYKLNASNLQTLVSSMPHDVVGLDSLENTQLNIITRDHYKTIGELWTTMSSTFNDVIAGVSTTEEVCGKLLRLRKLARKP